ncbi:hypothetical protein [Salipiger abyssi]|uniref:hypothetical protein n=1 Tax=Salipiger abyssi TaxID=1250539 RepID=UPI001A8E7595|nr:hypothetical protein [Salipiger abyssi]MBN9888523.1 hypothetical protein [Salipiger abyssi]
MSRINLPNGLDALMAELSLEEVMRLIERTARWVDPQTFALLPVWYPEYARRVYFFKSNWSEPQMNTNRTTGNSVHKQEGNLYANKALTHALGLRSDGRDGWTCCHLWGVDDAKYQVANAVVQDRRFFSCVANMVLLPTPLKAFTDTMPEVKSMLRICARNTYGWQCDHETQTESNELLDGWSDWQDYPESWPRKPGNSEPKGVMKINADIRKTAQRRWKAIQNDLQNAGPHYPRDEVLATLDYWKMDPAKPLAL